MDGGPLRPRLNDVMIRLTRFTLRMALILAHDLAVTALAVVVSAVSAGLQAAGSWSKHVKNFVTLLAAGESQIQENMASAHREVVRPR